MFKFRNAHQVCAPAQRGVGQGAPIKNMLFNGVTSVQDLHEIAGVIRDCCPNSLITAGGLANALQQHSCFGEIQISQKANSENQ